MEVASTAIHGPFASRIQQTPDPSRKKENAKDEAKNVTSTTNHAVALICFACVAVWYRSMNLLRLPNVWSFW